MELYPRLVAEVLRRTRKEALTTLLIYVINIPLLLFVLKFHGWVLGVFLVGSGLSIVMTLRKLFLMRSSSPRMQAVREPERLTRVRSWPYVPAAKNPKHKPVFLRFDSPSGLLRLKIGDDMQRFVDELAKVAPKLDIDVPNILVRPAA